MSDACTAPTNGTQTLGTISVSKDKSKTATAASYNGKKNVATGKAKVKGAKYKLPGTGKVKFTLKKGTHRSRRSRASSTRRASPRSTSST